ncbi:MAG: serpin family protein [Muribaculaceae bacterium]|nr:serpin family protein [Muribaculaceae bacterium]MDE5845585.1 serpin family protein [Muribaculaceae bacterium]MDE5856986.1 serpin family protein [Muribaculaceae bacterium]MDE7154915.1 serpin family protein [Muribaculaceae bacterium]MDE7369900.1 serpin family protein [Muribaculaceae bacterium]
MIQKCTLKGEETGAEGSALSEYAIVSSDIDSKPVLEENPSFTVDRPFIFWIMEENTNSCLFMGQINKL